MWPKIEEYYKHVSQRANTQEHKGFLQARKAWVSQHDQGGPDRKRLLSKKELQEAHKTMDLVSATGGRFVAPKKQFVTKDGWLQEEHGEWDPSKVVKESLFGKEQEGIWINKGAKGVFDWEEFQETKVEERERVHNSKDAPFSEEALARKRSAVMAEFCDASQARDKAAVEGTSIGNDAMLALIRKATGQVPTSTPATQQEGATASGEVAAKDSSGSSSDEGAESDAEPTSFFAASAAKAKAAATAKASAAKAAAKAGAGAQASTSGAGGTAPKSTAASAAPKVAPKRRGDVDPSGKPGHGSAKAQRCGEDAAGTLLADGRAQRSLKNLQESTAAWRIELAKVKVDDEPPAADAASQAAFKQDLIARQAPLKVLTRSTRDYLKRLEKSTNKDLLEAELEKLRRLDAAAHALLQLFQTVCTSLASPDSLVSACTAASDHAGFYAGQALGPCFLLKCALAKAAQHCLYGNYESYCSMLLKTDPDMQKLAGSMGEEKLKATLVSEVEGRVLLTLRAVKPEDVEALAGGQGDVERISDSESLCQAVVKFSAQRPREFLACDLGEACKLAASLLNQDDIAATQEAHEKVQALQADAKELSELGTGALLVFFAQYSVGQALCDLASSRVTSGEQEAAAAKALTALQNAVEQLQGRAPNWEDGAVLGVRLVTEHLAPVQKLLDECSTKLAGMKGKRKTKGHERIADQLNGFKSEFCNATQRLLRGELQANITQRLPLGASQIPYTSNRTA